MAVRSIVLASAMVAGVSFSAAAAPIATGSQISLTGYLQSIGSVTLNAATGLDFVSGPAGSASAGRAGTLVSYGAGSGSFAGLACTSGACGSVQDLPTLTVGAHTMSNFLSLAGGNEAGPITFDLADITEIDRLASGVLAFQASGTIRYGSFDPTAGSFTFSAQGDQIISFVGTVSASTNQGGGVSGSAFTPAVPALTVADLAAPIPEPAAFATLGSGIVALLASRRKRRRQTSQG